MFCEQVIILWEQMHTTKLFPHMTTTCSHSIKAIIEWEQVILYTLFLKIITCSHSTITFMLWEQVTLSTQVFTLREQVITLYAQDINILKL